MAFQTCLVSVRPSETTTHLRDEHLGLVLDLHVLRGEHLGVDALGQARVDVLPRRPDGEAEGEGARDGEDRVPDDVPQERVEEELRGSAERDLNPSHQREVHDEHHRQRERWLVHAQADAEQAVRAVLDLHPAKVSRAREAATHPTMTLIGFSNESVRKKYDSVNCDVSAARTSPDAPCRRR